MSVLCIIPARAGSKRLPGKNWEKVGGRSLVERALRSAPGPGRATTVVVSDEFVDVGAFPAHWLQEPKELAVGDVPMNAVVRWVCENEQPADAVLLLQPTSPFRTAEDVSACLRMSEVCYEADSIVSVTYDLETKGYKRNGAIYLTDWDHAARGELMSGWTQFYVMPPERSIDINTAEDLAEARRIAGD